METMENKKIRLDFGRCLSGAVRSGATFKKNAQIAYEKAVVYGINTDNHSLLTRFFHTMNENKLIPTRALYDIIKNTNKDFTYNKETKALKQGKDFSKDNTIILQDIFSIGKESIEKVFSLENAVGSLLKRAIKNGFSIESIMTEIEKQKTK